MSRRTEPRRIPALAVGVAAIIGVGGALVPATPASADDIFAYIQTQTGDPVVFLDVIVTEDATGDTWPVTTSGFGTIELDGVPAGDYTVTPTSDLDVNGYGYRQNPSLAFSTSDVFPSVTLDRYGKLSGTITDWTPEFVGAELDVWYFDPVSSAWTFTGITGSTTDGDFTIPAVWEGGDYTLGVYLDPRATAPYRDGFLGLTAEPSTGVAIGFALDETGVSVALRPAALIQGTVTTFDGTQPLAGIDLTAEDADAPSEDFYGQTDADGRYTLRVAPGESYAIYADDPAGRFRSEVYDDKDPCGCGGAPDYVTPALGTPETADFDLSLSLAGAAGIDVIAPYPGLTVHVYRKVTGGWLPVATGTTDGVGYYEVVIPRAGEYRLRFSDGGTWIGFRGADGALASAPAGTSFGPGCFLDTGVIDLSAALLGYAHIAFVDFADPPSTVCGPEPAIAGGSGGAGTRAPRPSAGASAAADLSSTPTPTPTSTATPRPSATPTPSATPAPEPTPASAPDLWWVLWVLLAIVVVAIVGGVIWFARRA